MPAESLTGQHPGLGHHGFDRLKDPIRTLRSRQPTPPVRQRRRMESALGDRQPARRFPPQIEGDRLDSLVIGQAMQRLQSDHTGHHFSRHTRSTPTRRKQVSEHLLREQLTPMRCKKRKHTVRLQKMTGHRLGIQKLTLIIRTTLHPLIIPKTPAQPTPPRGINSAGS